MKIRKKLFVFCLFFGGWGRVDGQVGCERKVKFL